MTRIIGSLVSLIDSIQIDDNIPLPSKKQKEEKSYVAPIKSSEPLITPSVVVTNDVHSLLTRSRLTPGHLRWRSSICRYKRNERIW